VPLSDAERRSLDTLARAVVRWGLTTPALLFFESVRPLGRVGAAALTFFHPMLDALMPSGRYLALRDLLERRDALEALLARIEELAGATRSGAAEPRRTSR